MRSFLIRWSWFCPSPALDASPGPRLVDGWCVSSLAETRVQRRRTKQLANAPGGFSVQPQGNNLNDWQELKALKFKGYTVYI